MITDYTSERLDLSDPASYRDLSKPVGALDQKRLAFFRERFESLQVSIAALYRQLTFMADRKEQGAAEQVNPRSA